MENRQKFSFLFATFVASTSIALTPSVATADDFTCPPNLTGVIPGNVVVPPGLTCFLIGADVHGNVTALENSTLFVTVSKVRGNIEGARANAVQVSDSFVSGGINIVESQSTSPLLYGSVVLRTGLADGSVHIQKGTCFVATGNVVTKGNIKVEENRSGPHCSFGNRIEGNSVAGNLQVFRNRGAELKTVIDNFVFENLQCFENDPLFIGSPNVARQAQGQCMAAPLPTTVQPVGGQ